MRKQTRSQEIYILLQCVSVSVNCGQWPALGMPVWRRSASQAWGSWESEPPNPLAGARLNPRSVLLWIQWEQSWTWISFHICLLGCLQRTPSFLPKSYLNSRCPRVGVAEGLRQLVMSTWAQFSYYGLLEFGQSVVMLVRKEYINCGKYKSPKRKDKK